MKILGLISIALVLPLAGYAQPTPETEEQKTLYLYGAGFGETLKKSMRIDPDELEFIKAGMNDGFEGKALQVTPGEGFNPNEAMNELIKQRSLAATRVFLAQEKNASGATIYPSGLILTEIKAGSGDSPTAEQTVVAHYHGTLADGTVFDSSVERGEPSEFPLSRVIPCWTEGLQKMKKGGKSRLVCPPEIAYGDRGAPGRIPPGSALVFEVELVDIKD